MPVVTQTEPCGYVIDRTTVCELGPRQLLIATPSGGTLVRDDLAELVKDLLTSARRTITDAELEALCARRGCELAAVLQTLRSQLGFLQRAVAPVGFDSVHFFGPRDRLLELAVEHFQQLLSVPVLACPEALPGPSACPLVVNVLSTYDEAAAARVYERYRSVPRAGFSSMYFLSRYAYIDGLHVPPRGTPCHYCQFHEVRESYARTAESGQIESYYQLALRLGTREALAIPRTAIEDGAAVWYLFHTLSAFIADPTRPRTVVDQLTLGTRIDLHDGTRERFQALHWPLCACLGEATPTLSSGGVNAQS